MRALLWRTLRVVLSGVSTLGELEPCDAQVGARQLRRGSCVGCRIELTVVATLGDSTALGGVLPTSQVARVGAHKFLVAPTATPGTAVIYDDAGRVFRAVGRRGGGPGELSSYLGPLVSDGDRAALLFDLGNGRAVLVDSAGRLGPFGPIRGIVHGAVSVSRGTFVVNMLVRTAQLFGHTLHVVTEGSRISKSFGELGTVAPAEANVKSVRILGSDGAGGIWYSPNDEYTLVHVDTAGRVLDILARPLRSEVAPDGTMSFAVASVWQGKDGLLWVTSISRTGGTPEVRRDRLPPGSQLRAITSSIDVIDPKAGLLLASLSAVGPAARAIEPGLAYRYREDKRDTPRLEVVSIRLVRGR